ncbi:hexuronate transporter [Collimonas arenae]|uniref:Hexuronate transporter n=1 Tax=Collimonas arenae TaxID=279058 RepID=A0A127PLX7_9BURK|nr:MFS transporter [Collimonas arenae]AMO98624.1 hexuronate transporter [Collimonas arenae]AMP08513.1 hexuronate transporter [Collimonas arenae]
MKRIKGLRWWIIALVCFGTILNYISRNSLGVLADTLKHDLDFTTKEYSYVVAAFQVAYTIMQPVCGYIIDFLGLKVGFALFAAAWSVVGMLHGFATGWMSLAFFRGLLGLTEAAAIPAGIKAVSEWFPKQERSVAVGYFNAGTSMGAVIAPVLVAWLLYKHSWQAAFIVTGAMGFIFAGLWFFFYRAPKDHPNLSETERDYILSGQESIAESQAHAKPSIKTIVSTRRFWGIAITRFLAEPAWQTFNFWIPLYFISVRGMNLKEFAIFGWMPFFAADMGGILGGYLSPFMMKHFKLKLVNSRIAGIATGALLMTSVGFVGYVQSPYTAIALFCIGGFAHQMISGLVNTMTTDVFNTREVGTANGLTGMISWIGGLSFSLLIGQLAESIGYTPLFAALGMFDVVGATILFLLYRGYKDNSATVART